MGRPITCLCGSCKTCKARAAKRRYVARHPEYRQRQTTAARAKHAAEPTPHREALERSRKADLNRARAHGAKQRERNRESYRAKSRVRTARYRKRHLERARAATREAERVRRAQSRDAACREGAAAFAVILRADPCSYCGAPCEHIDHITALAAGGEHSPENLTAACAPCNSRKSARPLLLFLRESRGS